jgi:CRISPR-associated protein Csb1
MPLNLAPLDTASRLLIEADLKVATGGGGRFQPTGFPDLGPALYKGVRSSPNPDKAKPVRTETVDMLLVESVQSMANRLEDVCLQGEDYNSDCQGIPYVRVLDGHRGNEFLTSSVREPHRLASPYILGAKRNDAVYRDEMKTALGANKQRPVHIWKMVPAIFDRDPGCVLHGVFLEEIDGRIRLPRLVSAYIEACSPNQANSGGVYRGEVTAKDNIPYPRQEFTSTSITASFIVHLSTLKGYCLDESRRRFLQSWAIYKIDRFLNDYLRLRTACEFEVAGVAVTLDGKPADLGDGPEKWPKTGEITAAFVAARDTCFPKLTDGEEWAKRRVSVVTYAVDVVGKEALPEGILPDVFKLEGFTDRVEVKQVTEGKGAKKKTYTALIITGEWPEEDQSSLLAQNPEKKETDQGDEEENPGHDILKKALKKWNDAWKKVQKKMAGTEETEVPE